MNDDEVYSYDTTLFYKSLQTRYRKHFETIQDQNGLICIPLRNVTEERLLISNFVFKHLYLPSPFLKNLYSSINNQEFDVLFSEKNSCNLFVLDKINKITFIAKVLGEQVGYAFDQKSYKILIIEYPLFEFKETNVNSNDAPVASKSQVKINENKTVHDVSNFKKSSYYLQKTSNSVNECFKNEMRIFKETYVILLNHLEACEQECLRIHEKYFKKFQDSYYSNSNQEILSIAIENCINANLYDKLWSIIIDLNNDKDNFINFKLNQIYNNISNDNVTSYYLKLNKKYLIDYSLSINEIRKIHLLKTVFEKLNCMKTCIDLISTELSLYYKKNESNNQISENELVLTSDELLPLTCYIIIKAKLNLLYSLIFFTERFNFTAIFGLSNSLYLSSTNELAFIFSTFKAAIGLIEHYT